jgi:riboflavin biosynthesis pyrimidine reductase
MERRRTSRCGLFWWTATTAAAAACLCCSTSTNAVAAGAEPTTTTPGAAEATAAIAIEVVLALVQAAQARFLAAQERRHEQPLSSSSSAKQRPFVTLAFAQSLDGKIAIRRPSTGSNTTVDDDEDADTDAASTSSSSFSSSSSNLPISGPASLLLTHGLRARHDGILIGRRTAQIDTPRLTNRLYKSDNDHQHHHNENKHQRHQPRPIIIDPRQRLAESVLRNFPERPILVVLAAVADASADGAADGSGGTPPTRTATTTTTTPATTDIVSAPPTENSEKMDDGTAIKRWYDVIRVGRRQSSHYDDDGHNNATSGRPSPHSYSERLDLPELLRLLREEYRLDSIMVEGGAATLRSFLQQRRQQPRLYDCLTITINPHMVLGQSSGISPFDDADHLLGGRNDDGDDDDDDDDMVLINVVRLGQDLQLTYIRRSLLCHPDDEEEVERASTF